MAKARFNLDILNLSEWHKLSQALTLQPMVDDVEHSVRVLQKQALRSTLNIDAMNTERVGVKLT